MPQWNLKRLGRDSLVNTGELVGFFADHGFAGLKQRWSGRAGQDQLATDAGGIAALAAGGMIAFRAFSGIGTASDNALDSAASAAGNLLGYRMTMNALNMVPGL